jgi:hypothetical protein
MRRAVLKGRLFALSPLQRSGRKAVASAPICEQQIGQMRGYEEGPQEERKKQSNKTLFQSPKRPSEYQGYRTIMPDRAGNAMPILIGAAIIAAAILLSTLITAVGTRFVGMESPNDEAVWLIDRLTGNVYKCQASEHGKAACETEIATGSIGERGKR